jgi:hypothetical protein
MAMLRALLFGIGLVAVGSSPASGQAGPSQCAALQYKAQGAYANQIARCRAQGVAKGLADDPRCEAKANRILLKRFAKAEKKGDCLGVEVPLVSEVHTDECLADLAPAIEGRLICCTFGTDPLDRCTYLPEVNVGTCTGDLGVVGPPGSVCDGATGSCIAGPATPGECCDGFASNTTAGSCIAGSVNAVACENDGRYVASGICLQTGRCLPQP